MKTAKEKGSVDNMNLGWYFSVIQVINQFDEGAYLFFPIMFYRLLVIWSISYSDFGGEKKVFQKCVLFWWPVFF